MSEIESQLEQAAREMGVEMISQPEQMPQEDSQSQESMEQSPVQVDTQPLPGEEVLEIQTEPTDQTESSLNEESTEAYVEAEEDFDVDSAVTQYLSETLGIELSSIQDLLGLIQQPQETQQAEIDERLRVIADFMAETGRNPEDWFMYQSINQTKCLT